MAKKLTMSKKILAFVKENPGMTAEQVAQKLGTKKQYVHTVMYMARKAKNEKKVAKKIGRPKKHVTMAVPAGVPVEFSSAQAETIRSLRKEIDELTVVIAYLEHRCSRAEASRGTTV